MNKQDGEKAISYELSNDLKENFRGELEEAFLSGCEWKEQQMIEKAVEWLKEIENGTTITNIEQFIEGFKKYLEEN